MVWQWRKSVAREWKVVDLDDDSDDRDGCCSDKGENLNESCKTSKSRMVYMGMGVGREDSMGKKIIEGTFCDL